MSLPRGRIKKPIAITGIRPLTKDDLSLLAKPREVVNRVARFRDTHHRLARLLATGLRYEEAAAACGYSYARVAALAVDPTFQQLIAEKRKLVDQAFVEGVDDYYELATSNMLKAERMLSEKLDKADEENELLPTRELIAISRDAADRFGYGKHTTQTNVNVDFAAKLESMRRRSGKTIDGTSVAINPAPGVRSIPPKSAEPPVQRRKIA